MDWKTEIKLTYRIFARQHRNVEDQFKDVLSKVGCASLLCLTVGRDLELRVTDCEDLLIPIRQLDIEQATRDGKLVVDRGGKTCLLVYQWGISVQVGEAGTAEEWLSAILQSTGEVFTNIQIVRECLTNVTPV